MTTVSVLSSISLLKRTVVSFETCKLQWRLSSPEFWGTASPQLHFRASFDWSPEFSMLLVVKDRPMHDQSFDNRRSKLHRLQLFSNLLHFGENSRNVNVYLPSVNVPVGLDHGLRHVVLSDRMELLKSFCM